MTIELRALVTGRYILARHWMVTTAIPQIAREGREGRGPSPLPSTPSSICEWRPPHCIDSHHSKRTPGQLLDGRRIIQVKPCAM